MMICVRKEKTTSFHQVTRKIWVVWCKFPVHKFLHLFQVSVGHCSLTLINKKGKTPHQKRWSVSHSQNTTETRKVSFKLVFVQSELSGLWHISFYLNSNLQLQWMSSHLQSLYWKEVWRDSSKKSNSKQRKRHEKRNQDCLLIRCFLHTRGSLLRLKVKYIYFTSILYMLCYIVLHIFTNV